MTGLQIYQVGIQVHVDRLYITVIVGDLPLADSKQGRELVGCCGLDKVISRNDFAFETDYQSTLGTKALCRALLLDAGLRPADIRARPVRPTVSESRAIACLVHRWPISLPAIATEP